MSKNNTEQTKTFLQKAISSMPDDFALREVKFHLKQAAQKLEQIEKKRATHEPKQPTQHQKWHERLNAGLQNPYTGQNTLNIINDMLSEEQAKLEEILKKKKVGGDAKDGEDTLLG